jgi:DNA-directed RNA polymerase subunit M/transcription elongation factor TFIIS
MSISFQCPQCGKKLKAPDNAAGKSSSCPGCGNTVTCPEPVYDAEVVEMEVAPDKPKGFDPFADLDDDKPYKVAGTPPPAQSADDGRRPCPMCGEMIVATAAKCRYCGEVFDPTLKKAKSKKKKKKSYDPEDESLSGSEIAIGIICSGIGCIAGLVWMIQGKPKGLKMVGLSIIADIVKSVIVTIIKSSQNGNMGN